MVRTTGMIAFNTLRSFRKIAIALLPCLCIAAAASGAEWLQWRGPAFNGSTTETNLPFQWTRTNGYAWKTPLPGVAGSTPVICGDSIFLTSPNAEKNLLLIRIDARSGNEVWRRTISGGDQDKGRNNMSSPSPCTDGTNVYVMFGTGKLAGFDFEGHQLWARDIATEYGSFAYMWIYGASPLLMEGRLYIPVLQRSPIPGGYGGAAGQTRESYLLCLDARTGTNLWRHLRTTGAQNESMESYTTPIPVRSSRGPEVLLFGAGHLTAHDALTGRETWRSPYLNTKNVEWWRVVPCPVVAGDIAVVCAPRREPVFGLRWTGPATNETAIAWSYAEFPSDCPSPLLYKGRLYVLDGDRQTLTCMDPSTGSIFWKGNLGVRDAFRASPLGADGRIYCVSESGNVIIVGTGEAFEVLSTIPMGEAPVRSSFVAANGKLYLRTGSNLYCFTNSEH